MKVHQVCLAATAVRPAQYPVDTKIEIAFVGKSNVGKSSLLNTLINRKALARISSNPGKTRTINFYNVEDMLYFVDLPGYGYAKISKTEQEKWGKMIEEYLGKRNQLKNVVLLVDIRHEPRENDILMYKWIRHYAFEVIVVATKLDKIKKSQVQKHVSIIRKALEMKPEEKVIPFSTETKQGKEELWAVFDAYIQKEIPVAQQE